MSGAAGGGGEPREVRLKRLAMRCARRGTREMDLLLARFAPGLPALSEAELDALEALLAEPDPELLLWLTGQRPAPGRHAALVARIRAAIAS